MPKAFEILLHRLRPAATRRAAALGHLRDLGRHAGLGWLRNTMTHYQITRLSELSDAAIAALTAQLEHVERLESELETAREAIGVRAR